jgi:hypothetical protein
MGKLGRGALHDAFAVLNAAPPATGPVPRPRLLERSQLAVKSTQNLLLVRLLRPELRADSGMEGSLEEQIAAAPEVFGRRFSRPESLG